MSRSEFTLKATAGVGFKLDAFGQLSLSATVLSILKGSESKEAEEDPGFLTIDLVETDVLPIVENLGGGGRSAHRPSYSSSRCPNSPSRPRKSRVTLEVSARDLSLASSAISARWVAARTGRAMIRLMQEPRTLPFP